MEGVVNQQSLPTISAPLPGDQDARDQLNLVKLSRAQFQAQHPGSDFSGGCYDDRTEVQQVFGYLEETESEVEKILDGVDIEGKTHCCG